MSTALRHEPPHNHVGSSCASRIIKTPSVFPTAVSQQFSLVHALVLIPATVFGRDQSSQKREISGNGCSGTLPPICHLLLVRSDSFCLFDINKNTNWNFPIKDSQSFLSQIFSSALVASWQSHSTSPFSSKRSPGKQAPLLPNSSAIKAAGKQRAVDK